MSRLALPPSDRSLVLILIISTIVGGFVLVAGLGGPPVGCAPQAEFVDTYHVINDTLVISHDGGDDLLGRISINITDSETNATETVVWVPGNSDRRIQPGDRIVITDREDGESVRAPWVSFDLGSGDRVHIKWEGTRLGENEVCSDEEAVLDRFTLG